MTRTRFLSESSTILFTVLVASSLKVLQQFYAHAAGAQDEHDAVRERFGLRA